MKVLLAAALALFAVAPATYAHTDHEQNDAAQTKENCGDYIGADEYGNLPEVSVEPITLGEALRTVEVPIERPADTL